MTISIGGVILSKSTVWSDRQLSDPILQSRKLTLGGRQIVTHSTLLTGRVITLEGQADTGWVTSLVYAQLQALETPPGTVYTFDYNGETHNVILMHDDPPALSGEPLVYRNAQEDTDYYTYTLKLVTV